MLIIGALRSDMGFLQRTPFKGFLSGSNIGA